MDQSISFLAESGKVRLLGADPPGVDLSNDPPSDAEISLSVLLALIFLGFYWVCSSLRQS